MTDEQYKQLEEALKPVLIVHEGERLKPYLDTKGIMTIGIGHNMIANPLPKDIAEYLEENGCITKEMEDKLFSLDLDKAIESCLRLYPNFYNFPEHIQMALIDIMFNMGYSKLKNDFAQTVAHINAEQWDDVIDHLQHSKWYTQVHQRAKDDIALIEEVKKEG